jgi:hypothetical protein
MEFVLLRGRPRRTKVMQMGSDRHAQLEKEVCLLSSSWWLQSIWFNVLSWLPAGYRKGRDSSQICRGSVGQCTAGSKGSSVIDKAVEELRSKLTPCCFPLYLTTRCWKQSGACLTTSMKIDQSNTKMSIEIGPDKEDYLSWVAFPVRAEIMAPSLHTKERKKKDRSEWLPSVSLILFYVDFPYA